MTSVNGLRMRWLPSAISHVRMVMIAVIASPIPRATEVAPCPRQHAEPDLTSQRSDGGRRGGVFAGAHEVIELRCRWSRGE